MKTINNFDTAKISSAFLGNGVFYKGKLVIQLNLNKRVNGRFCLTIKCKDESELVSLDTGDLVYLTDLSDYPIHCSDNEPEWVLEVDHRKMCEDEYNSALKIWVDSGYDPVHVESVQVARAEFYESMGIPVP